MIAGIVGTIVGRNQNTPVTRGNPELLADAVSAVVLGMLSEFVTGGVAGGTPAPRLSPVVVDLTPTV